MNQGELPNYLKSLESLIGPAAAGASAPSAAAAAAPSAATSSLSLSSIGFGSLFTGAGLATRGVVPAAAAAAAPASEKLRFILASTHLHQFTGYAKVTQGILTELAKQPWLDLTHFGFQKFAAAPPDFRPYPEGVEVIDAAAMERPFQQGFAFSVLPDVIRRKKPHVVMIYNDLSVVAQYLEAIRKSGLPRNFQIWVYCDQVYTTQTQGFLDILNRDADRVFAFSPFWKKCLKDQGITRPVDVLLHGFNPRQFFSMPKELARTQLALPKDMFLFLNLNRNQPRKRYDILLMAFTELIVKYPTKPIFLLCVCDKGEKGGWWLFEVYANELKRRGVPVEHFGNRLIVTSQSLSFKDEEINLFYNAADAGITTADGEGWGLCQFEQMGVGVPQVVPDIGGFKEFCRPENSMLVTPKIRYYLPSAFSPVGGEAAACDPHDVCMAMEEYVLNSEKVAAHGKAAKECVTAYTWERACETLVRRLRNVKDGDD